MASGGALAPGLARKVNKILETRTESPELLGALATLSAFYGENTTDARRRLRTTIEQRGLAINEQFLLAAEAVIQALDGVQHEVEGVAAGCKRINGALQASRAASAEMVAETERIARDLASSRTRAGLVTHFLDQYQLSSDEVAALQGEEIGDAFFGALERVRSIHANCRSLLRTHHQRAGLELMDAMSAYQETAYERLCRWVQSECRHLGDADAPEVDPRLQRAAEALRERPVLFRYCAEEVASVRHNALFQRLIAALTRGGPGGMPRPIEMHAHDPRRYLGDMLAWTHQALASERELLTSLFGEDGLIPSRRSTQDGEGAVPPRYSAGDGVDTPNTAVLLDRVFESICRPIKVRIEQVLVAAPPLLLCFKVAQLLSFYAATVAELLGPHAQLTETLEGCRNLARRVFGEQLRARGDRLLRFPPPPPPDLSPPQQVVEALQQLLDLVASFTESYESAPAGSAETDFAPVLSAALDPLLEVCERSAEALAADAPSRVDEESKVDPSARRVYLINCLALIGGALAGRPVCAARATGVGELLEAHVSRLVGAEVGSLLARCNMAELVERIRLYQGGEFAEGGVMANDPALPLTRIGQATRAFYGVVSNPDALPEFRHLQVPRIKADATARVARSLAEAYDDVHRAVLDPVNGYSSLPGAAEAVRHSPMEIRTILGVLYCTNDGPG